MREICLDILTVCSINGSYGWHHVNNTNIIITNEIIINNEISNNCQTSVHFRTFW